MFLIQNVTNNILTFSNLINSVFLIFNVCLWTSETHSIHYFFVHVTVVVLFLTPISVIR